MSWVLLRDCDRVAATLNVPRLMTDDRKANSVRACQELLDGSDEDENSLLRITSTKNCTAIRNSFRLSVLQLDKRKKHSLLKTV